MPAAGHRPDIRIAHFLQIVGRKRRAKSAAAIEDHLGVFVGECLHDVAFDNASANVFGTGGVTSLKLIVFANVYKHRSVPYAIQRLLPLPHARGSLRPRQFLKTHLNGS